MGQVEAAVEQRVDGLQAGVSNVVASMGQEVQNVKVGVDMWMQALEKMMEKMREELNEVKNQPPEVTLLDMAAQQDQLEGLEKVVQERLGQVEEAFGLMDAEHTKIMEKMREELDEVKGKVLSRTLEVGKGDVFKETVEERMKLMREKLDAFQLLNAAWVGRQNAGNDGE